MGFAAAQPAFESSDPFLSFDDSFTAGSFFFSGASGNGRRR
jgi:hypothetical protein